MSIRVLILNYNGRDLLAECLGTVVTAAARSRHDCRVLVVDNASTDSSLAWLAENFPCVEVIHAANRGLCSYNDALAQLECRVAVLLNNDIKLAPDAIDALTAPLLQPPEPGESPCFMTTPRARLFDDATHEGFKTAVRWRWGLVQATARFPGCERAINHADWTASAGAALAVDRRILLELGGFDPLYLPGRIEDLDFAYRAFVAGYHARYVPESLCWHRGQATFDRELGTHASAALALRNTLLFQWKNLRRPTNIARQALGAAARLTHDVLRAPLLPGWRRFPFARAWRAARIQWREFGGHERARCMEHNTSREREFFTRFAPARMIRNALPPAEETEANEARLALRHPISRWYACPVASALARQLAPTAMRPAHVTMLGALFAVFACWTLVSAGGASWMAAGLLWLAWLCDRLDGALARRQDSQSAWGARLDAHVDEATDAATQTALAFAAASASDSLWPVAFLLMFLAGKYWLLRGICLSQDVVGQRRESAAGPLTRWRALLHLPGNTDIRVHLLMFAVATGLGAWELAFLAVYYNGRWIARSVRGMFSRTDVRIERANA